MTELDVGVLLTATEASGVTGSADWARWEQRPGVARSGRGFGFEAAPGDWLGTFAGELGASSVVLTLEWSALQPHEGRYDSAVVETLRDRLTMARDRGLAPWGCLVDTTLPGWFSEDRGGFVDDAARTLLWPRHIDWVGETFGDLVAGWVTQREPVRQALRGWLWGAAPPGRRDPRRAAEAVRAAVLADGEAWRLLQGAGPPVATIHTARTIHPADDQPESRSAARQLDGLWWRSWTSALVDGEVQVPGLAPVDAPHMRGAFDLVGLQLRASTAVGGDGTLSPYPPDRQTGPSGGAPWPPGLAAALRRAAEEVPERALAVITDVADAPADGRHQADHLEAIVDEVLAARSDGIPITTWWQSSPVDGYRWERGQVPGGVLDRDGRPKDAAAVLARLRGDDGQTRER